MVQVALGLLVKSGVGRGTRYALAGDVQLGEAAQVPSAKPSMTSFKPPS